MIGRNKADVWTELPFDLPKHALGAGEQLRSHHGATPRLRRVPGDECVYGVFHN